MAKYETVPLAKGSAHLMTCEECGGVVLVSMRLVHDAFHSALAQDLKLGADFPVIAPEIATSPTANQTHTPYGPNATPQDDR